MDGLLRRVVLRQSAVHHPATHRQHHQEQADAEPAAKSMPSRTDPGTRVSLRSRVVVHGIFQIHPLFRCESAGDR